ncbi:MAG: hypothetical protein ACOC38_09110 [Promethearchaeia archaeon]
MKYDILVKCYEFFSWRGFLTGATIIGISLILQSVIGFPEIWAERPTEFGTSILISSVIVGTACGSVLVFLFPPNQDVIGVAGLGSDDASQHIALFLVLLALIEPHLAGFVFFFEYYGQDPFEMVWVLVSFGTVSAGFASAMLDRTKTIARDLRNYFEDHDTLDLTKLDWLQAVGPRNAAYRMGMLGRAAKEIEYVRVVGHQLIRTNQTDTKKNEN